VHCSHKKIDKKEGWHFFLQGIDETNVEDPEPAADGRSWRSLAFAVKAGAARQACAMHMNYSLAQIYYVTPIRTLCYFISGGL
jgi:hypothetical protein